jgi:flagellar biogenesis protein FliO
MSVGLVFQVVWALTLVGLLLFTLAYAARALQRGRVVLSSGRRLVTTIESTALAQNVAVHVVKVADRYYLVGGGSAGVALLAELPREEVEPYIDAQRRALGDQRAALGRAFARFRRS